MKRYNLSGFLVLVLALALLAGLSGPAGAQERATRDLVFEDEGAAAKPEGEGQPETVVAVKTQIELVRDGQKEAVPHTHQFKSGDKVKFLYTTNTDCYVYWLIKVASGDVYVLFPNPNDPRIGGDNWVVKNQIYQIPVMEDKYFTIKHKTPGEKEVEQIILVMAPEKFPELEEAAKVAGVKGSKTGGDAVAKLEEEQAEKRKTRDLVFEDEEDPQTGVRTQSQASPEFKEPMYVAFELVHFE
ncbi:MAG: DUF4384 domain-containing protein [Thermodesulfobacteriota bacterium]